MLQPLFLVKTLNYEYWPWWLVYLPLYPYGVYLALKTRSVAFVTGVNPAIEKEAFYGEKKAEILNKLPADFLPKSLLILVKDPVDTVIQKLDLSHIKFPLIAKPNIGHRGTGVEKLFDSESLIKYHSIQTEDYIIQEFVDYGIELGVFYSRFPKQKFGVVSSITQKEFLAVTGDGSSTIEQLMLLNPRARFQLETLTSKLGNGILEVLEKDQTKILVEIGNHCKGTKFINANHLINPKLNAVFDKILKDFDGFNYGRFDLKVKSINDLYEGKNIKIMELNGVSSDPAHIFDPGYNYLQALKDIAWHWKRLADISIANKKIGYNSMSIKELYQLYKSVN